MLTDHRKLCRFTDTSDSSESDLVTVTDEEVILELCIHCSSSMVELKAQGESETGWM